MGHEPKDFRPLRRSLSLLRVRASCGIVKILLMCLLLVKILLMCLLLDGVDVVELLGEHTVIPEEAPQLQVALDVP